MSEVYKPSLATIVLVAIVAVLFLLLIIRAVTR
jgi:hypothetical protein